MAMLKNKDIEKMSVDERQEKIKELNMELIKSRVNAAKGGKINQKTIKRTIARLLTFNRINNKSAEK